MELSDFQEMHPHPYELGIKSLYRFYSFKPEYLSHLFIEKKLYHTTANELNDPFECKPGWEWPNNQSERLKIRHHLIKLFRERGSSLRDANKEVTKLMVDKEKTRNIIIESAYQTLGKIRICSFTTGNENLLFWSHYADSHEGICIEFDAAKMPIIGAYKVKYQSDYPMIKYPIPKDVTALSPVLTKFKKWDYEEEFRTIFVSTAEVQPKNDGTSLLLEGNEIKSLSFGVKIDSNQKKEILKMVEQSSFTLRMYDAVQSKFSYSLDFVSFP